jgi:hypothetical protein
MHFQLPKPLHGWRQFAGEVGIIVIGVLIALAAQQLVEELSWRARVHEALNALSAQIADDNFNAAEMVVTQPCVDAQLVQVEQALERPGEWRPIQAYSDTFGRFLIRQPSRTWGGDVWRAMNTEGVASHVDPKLRLGIANFYSSTALLSAEQAEAVRLNWRLTALSGPLAPPAAERFRMIAHIEEWRGAYQMMKLSGNQVLGRVAALGIGQSATLDSDLAASGTVAFCRAHHLPLGKMEPVLK